MTDLNTMDKASLYLSSGFGLLSLLSSICVALEAAADWRERGKDTKIFTRIQLVLQLPLSCIGLMYLLTMFMSNYHPSLYFGNDVTCQTQGFLLFVGFEMAILLDLFLSITYMLMIKCQWQEDQFRRIEKWVHVVSWPIVIGSGLYVLHQRGIAPTSSICWLKNCEKIDPVCQQENQKVLLIKSFVDITALFHLGFSIYIMTTVYKFTQQATSQIGSVVAQRGFCYPGTIVVIQVPYLITAAFKCIHSSASLITLSASTLALGGLLNMLVFLLYRRNMKTAYGRFVRKVVDSLACYKYKEEPQGVPTGRDLFLTTTVNDAGIESQAVDLTEK